MRPQAIHHVSINVTDTEAARRFYVDVLGLTERTDRPDFGINGAWLDAGGQQVHLIESAAPPAMGQHFALLVDDLDATVEELRDHGLEVSDPSPVGPGRQAFTFDPAGNMVELNQPNR
jgi:catechol 2,3-dioxygenase-like lactoylglutathione lyase family enzyme